MLSTWPLFSLFFRCLRSTFFTWNFPLQSFWRATLRMHVQLDKLGHLNVTNEDKPSAGHAVIRSRIERIQCTHVMFSADERIFDIILPCGPNSNCKFCTFCSSLVEASIVISFSRLLLRQTQFRAIFEFLCKTGMCRISPVELKGSRVWAISRCLINLSTKETWARQSRWHLISTIFTYEYFKEDQSTEGIHLQPQTVTVADG